MKPFLFLWAILAMSFLGFTQQNPRNYWVKGKVVQADNKQPLLGASVYAENTTLGTTTDQDGNFALQLYEGGYGLVVSFAGFNTQSIRISQSDNKELFFEMTPKDKIMQDVAIVSTGEVKNGWEKYGGFFLNEFIGTTPNRDSCVLKNSETLKFFFSKRKNRLKVFATEPLLIENRALGFLLKYDMDSLVHEYNSGLTLYSGYPSFEYMNPVDENEKQRWESARKKAYVGSVLHFMKSLYRKDLGKNKFEVKFLVSINEADSALKLANYYDALRYEKNDSTGLVSIRPNQLHVGVLYSGTKPDETYLKQNSDAPTDFQFSTLLFQSGEKIFIEQNGFYFEQQDITINEYWEWCKMAEMLPYDYEP